MTIIGVTGHPASGKDMVADYLVSKGFAKISGGDILREKMTKLGIPTDRSHLHKFAAEMRQKYGNGFLSEETINRIVGNTVVSGIRNTEEVQIFIKKLGGSFKLVAVEAPLEIRYQWAKERNRIGDDISFEQFRAEEEKEKAKAKDTGSHEVDKVISTADFRLLNDGTKEQLFVKIGQILSQLSGKN